MHKKTKKAKPIKADKKHPIQVPSGEQAGVKLTQIFETYASWKSLPAVLRFKTEAELIEMGFDDIVMDLLTIKNQKEFAKKFGVKDETTLSEWNKKIYMSKEFAQGRLHWAKRLTSKIMLTLAEKAVKEGDAARIKLWNQIVEGWIEQTRDTGNSEAIEKMAQVLRDFAEGKI